MERLTERIGSSVIYSEFNRNNSDGCYEMMNNCLHKLADYEDAEQQGLLLMLPCKVGSTVYHIANKRILEVENVDVFFICLCVAEGRFGKTVFLTQSEAEQKLKEMESD